MSNFDREMTSDEFLAGIEDADERERFRREFCMVEFDEAGRLGFSEPQGSGPHATLNGAIIGADFKTYLLGNASE